MSGRPSRRGSTDELHYKEIPSDRMNSSASYYYTPPLVTVQHRGGSVRRPLREVSRGSVRGYQSARGRARYGGSVAFRNLHDRGKSTEYLTGIIGGDIGVGARGKRGRSSMVLHGAGDAHLQRDDAHGRIPITNRNLDKNHQMRIKKGIFYASDLVTPFHKEFPDIDCQCIIRFPPSIAQLLGCRQMKNQPLGLTITPTKKFDYRLYNIKVEGANEQLHGVLLELPNNLETFKTIDGDIMFKSGDISQMLYVYDASSKVIDWNYLSDKGYWEWKSGITPATRGIRTRKFKNFDIFDRDEIRDAELQILELLNSFIKDSYEYVAHTEFDMMKSRQKFMAGESQERVIGPEIDLTALIGDDELSDSSDVIFGFEKERSSGVKHSSFSTYGYPSLSLQNSARLAFASRLNLQERDGEGRMHGVNVGEVLEENIRIEIPPSSKSPTHFDQDHTREEFFLEPRQSISQDGYALTQPEYIYSTLSDQACGHTMTKLRHLPFEHKLLYTDMGVDMGSSSSLSKKLKKKLKQKQGIKVEDGEVANDLKHRYKIKYSNFEFKGDDASLAGPAPPGMRENTAELLEFDDMDGGSQPSSNIFVSEDKAAKCSKKEKKRARKLKKQLRKAMKRIQEVQGADAAIQPDGQTSLPSRTTLDEINLHGSIAEMPSSELHRISSTHRSSNSLVATQHLGVENIFGARAGPTQDVDTVFKLNIGLPPTGDSAFGDLERIDENYQESKYQ